MQYKGVHLMAKYYHALEKGNMIIGCTQTNEEVYSNLNTSKQTRQTYMSLF